MKIYGYLATIAALAAFTPGCGSSLTLVPVSGTVTVDGAPLADASVVFMPNVPNPDGETSLGASGPDGRYEVKTAGSSGVVPGKYRVVVSWKAPLDPALIPDEFKDDPFMAEMTIPPENKGKRKRADIPKQPEKIEGTFSHDVPADGAKIDLEVTKKAKPKTVPVRKSDR